MNTWTDTSIQSVFGILSFKYPNDWNVNNNSENWVFRINGSFNFIDSNVRNSFTIIEFKNESNLSFDESVNLFSKVAIEEGDLVNYTIYQNENILDEVIIKFTFKHENEIGLCYTYLRYIDGKMLDISLSSSKDNAEYLENIFLEWLLTFKLNKEKIFELKTHTK